MGHTIRIGEATTIYSDDPEQAPRPGAALVQRADAPAFVADRGNELRISCTAWYEFCQRTGLTGLFFGKDDGLMREEPGCFPLDLTALCCVESCLEYWQRTYPKVKPAFDDAAAARGDLTGHDLALLVWLQSWFEWSLDHCLRPIVANE